MLDYQVNEPRAWTPESGGPYGLTLMAAAYFLGHVIPGGFWPILNQGEIVIAYCWIFLYLAARGPGAWSIDGARAGTSEA